MSIVSASLISGTGSYSFMRNKATKHAGGIYISRSLGSFIGNFYFTNVRLDIAVVAYILSEQTS